MRETLRGADFVVLADYRGMNVGEMANLRREVKKSGGGLKIVKNTLFQRVLKESDFENLGPWVDGPTAAIFNQGEPAAFLRILNNWMKNQPKFQIRAGSLVTRTGEAGQILELAELKKLANLPPRQVLLGNVVSWLSFPLGRISSVLKSTLFNMVAVLGAIKAQKE